jgi:hypothetical protein
MNGPYEALSFIRKINELRKKIRKLPGHIFTPEDLKSFLDAFDELEKQTLDKIDSCLRDLVEEKN